MLDPTRRKLVVRQCKNQRSYAKGKWIAAILMDEAGDHVWVVDGRIDCDGRFHEEFAADQVFDTKEEAEIAAAKYVLL